MGKESHPKIEFFNNRSMADFPSIVFLCDFDGTISPISLCDYLYKNFASCGMKYSDLWAQGKVGTREEIESSFKAIQASREDMEVSLSKVPVVAGFKDFYTYCQNHKLDLIVASDGLEWAIRYVLKMAGVVNISVMANRIFFTDRGFNFDFPYFNPKFPRSGVYKLDIVERIKGEGRRVFLIGDGITDIEAAQAADFVFARDALWEYCQKQKIPSHPYQDFFEILAYICDPKNNLGI
jgi:2-hydroxy-3-keto-5-methylthiopentenyl-1-phosphate phosphatase